MYPVKVIIKSAIWIISVSSLTSTDHRLTELNTVSFAVLQMTVRHEGVSK